MFSIDHALDKFDLSVRETFSEKVTGIFGPSGSGKTSLLKSLIGLQKIGSGNIAWHGDVWEDTSRKIRMPVHKRKLGYVPQEPLLFPHLNVMGNLQMGVDVQSGEGEGKRLLEEVIGNLNLGELTGRNVDALSGGEKQRVALGRALLNRPRILLMDEPLASLDGNLKQQIISFLTHIVKTYDIPQVIVSHNPEELLALCNEVYFMEKGKVVEKGEPGYLFNQPGLMQHSDVIKFINLIRGTVLEKKESSTRILLHTNQGQVVLHAPPVDLPLKASIVVKIPARDIMISTSPVENISARNILPATVHEVSEVQNQVLIKALIEGSSQFMNVELSRDGAEDLGIAPQSHVYLIIKSNTIRIGF